MKSEKKNTTGNRVHHVDLYRILGESQYTHRQKRKRIGILKSENPLYLTQSKPDSPSKNIKGKKGSL